MERVMTDEGNAIIGRPPEGLIPEVTTWEGTFLERIRIPDVKDPRETWEVFYRCTTCLGKGSRVDHFCRWCGRKFVEREQ